MQDGGDQYFASFGAVYNELLETDSESIETLAADNWPFELKSPYVGIESFVITHSKSKDWLTPITAILEFHTWN